MAQLLIDAHHAATAARAAGAAALDPATLAELRNRYLGALAQSLHGAPAATGAALLDLDRAQGAFGFVVGERPRRKPRRINRTRNQGPHPHRPVPALPGHDPALRHRQAPVVKSWRRASSLSVRRLDLAHCSAGGHRASGLAMTAPPRNCRTRGSTTPPKSAAVVFGIVFRCRQPALD